MLGSVLFLYLLSICVAADPHSVDAGDGSEPLAAEFTAAVPASADTYIDSGTPTMSYGGATALNVGLVKAGSTGRALLWFPLSSLTGATIQSASLQLYRSGGSSTPTTMGVSLYRITQSWSELTTRWGNQPAAATLNKTTGVGTAPGYYQWDVRSLVQAWVDGDLPNYGVMARSANESTLGWRGFFSRENSANRPRLVIRYTATRTTDDPQVQGLRRLEANSTVPVQLRFRNGIPRFLRAAVATGAPATDPLAQARAFLTAYQDLYRLSDPTAQCRLDRRTIDAAGGHLALTQLHDGVPVYGSYLNVHIAGTLLRSVAAAYLPDLSLSVAFSIGPDKAERAAVADLMLGTTGSPAARAVGVTALVVFDRSLWAEVPSDPRLAWQVSVRSGGSWSYFVDAHTGEILHRLAEDRDGLDLELFNARGQTSWTCWIWPDDPSVLLYDEEGWEGDGDPFPEAENANAFIRSVYAYYRDRHGRRSYDNDDSQIEMFIRVGHEPPNAMWKSCGDLIEFSRDWALQDVVGHELTHGVTDYTANLIYEDEPGAANESLSDTFGEFIEQYATHAADWLCAEGIFSRGEDGGAGGTRGGAVGDGDRESGEECQNGVDDDGDGFVDEGCPEIDGDCGNGADDDGDGFIDEGCPETDSDCGDAADDDGDGFIDEGCPGSCGDGIDNGGDGETDSGDPSCSLRDMSDPPRGGDPDTYAGYVDTNRDNGGVHTNSGILNKAAWLISQWGENTHNGIAVEGIGTLDAEQIFYHALAGHPRLIEVGGWGFWVVGHMGPSSDFADFRDAMVLSADELFGAASAQACAVRNAYAAVGLGEPDTDCDGTEDGTDTDDDGDFVLDAEDTCPLVADPRQTDTDGNGAGDACDPDDDGDGTDDSDDNCRLIANADQLDTDHDGVGEACDDDDGDDVYNLDDNCPVMANRDQADYDGDGEGDLCDADSDDDGILDDGDYSGRKGDSYCTGGDRTFCDDNAPLEPNNDQRDNDADGVGDVVDNCPGVASPYTGPWPPVPADNDGDGLGDACDEDDDNDKVPDPQDNCQFEHNPDQINLNLNDLGLACDADEAFMLSGGWRDIFVRFESPELPVKIPIFPCVADDCPEYGATFPDGQRLVVSLLMPQAFGARISDEIGAALKRDGSDSLTKTLSFLVHTSYRFEPGAMTRLNALDGTLSTTGGGTTTPRHARRPLYYLELFATPTTAMRTTHRLSLGWTSVLPEAGPYLTMPRILRTGREGGSERAAFVLFEAHPPSSATRYVLESAPAATGPWSQVRGAVLTETAGLRKFTFDTDPAQDGSVRFLRVHEFPW